METSILIIEESLDLCRLLEYTLRADGYTVYSVHSWQAADVFLHTHQPDLIIFDWLLTNIPGYVWAQSLRQSPDTAHIPMLFVCAEPPTFDVREAINNMGISMINKPFDIFNLRNYILMLIHPSERTAGMYYM